MPETTTVTKVKGLVLVELLDEAGNVVDASTTENLTTDYGDEYNAKKAGGLSVSTVTGMRLGTGTTVAAKNGAGSTIVTYITGSAIGLEGGGPPVEALVGSGGAGASLTWKSLWPAGTATNSAITEVCLTNETGPTDSAGVASNTIARTVFSSAQNKTSSLQMRVTWTWYYLGADL